MVFPEDQNEIDGCKSIDTHSVYLSFPPAKFIEPCSSLLQNELTDSRQETSQQAKRVQLFQAELELLQSVEQRLKEEMAALRETSVQLELEKNETLAKLNANLEDHQSQIQQLESKLKILTVRQTQCSSMRRVRSERI